ncbi:MAG: hypothetical protein ABEH77_09225 [Halobacteriaceae archaeon]
MRQPSGRNWLRTAALDVAGLALVVGVLAAVHFLGPAPLQRRLAFGHDLARPHTLLTSAYVHNSDRHLWGNVVGYAAAAGYAYLICAGLGERRWFRLTALALFAVLPGLVNLASQFALALVYAGPLPPSRGFSGVAAGFAGFLYVAVLALVRAAYGPAAAKNAGLLLFAALAAEVMAIYADGPPVVGAALVALLVGVVATDAGRRGSLPASSGEWSTLLAVGLQVALVGAMLGLLVFGLFPADVVVGGTFRNVFAHAAGLGFGATIAAWGYRYWGRAPGLSY